MMPSVNKMVIVIVAGNDLETIFAITKPTLHPSPKAACSSQDNRSIGDVNRNRQRGSIEIESWFAHAAI